LATSVLRGCRNWTPALETRAPLIVLQTFAPVVLFLGGWCAARADDHQAEPSRPHPEVRAALRTEFRFGPSAKEGDPPAPAWSTKTFVSEMPPASADEPGVVRMPAMIVKGDRTSRELAARLGTQAANSELRENCRRLGIGVHEHRLGRAMVYAVTVFYIPITVGISW